MEVGGQVCVKDDRVTERAFFCDSLEFEGERVEARPQRLHEEQLPLLREVEQCLQLRCVGRSRLLAQNVLARI